MVLYFSIVFGVKSGYKYQELDILEEVMDIVWSLGDNIHCSNVSS